MGVLRIRLMFFPASKWKGKVLLSTWMIKTQKTTHSIGIPYN